MSPEAGAGEELFDVFARKNRGDPLSHIGYLQAPDRELARLYAWKTYDEESWFELCIVPRKEVVPVSRPGGTFAPDRREWQGPATPTGGSG